MVKPLGDRVVIQVEETSGQEKSAGGIILPVTKTKELPTKGTIIAVSKAVDEEGEIKIGDAIIYDKYAGSPFTLTGDTNSYIMVRVDDILGIL